MFSCYLHSWSHLQYACPKCFPVEIVTTNSAVIRHNVLVDQNAITQAQATIQSLTEENAALREMLEKFCTLSNGLSMIFRTEGAGYDLEYAKKYAAKLYEHQCNSEAILNGEK